MNPLEKAIEKKMNVAGSLLDLSKAYNSIGSRFLQKIIKIIFSESAITMLNSFISNRQQKKTFVINLESNWLSLLQEVPQGNVQRPLIFYL